ncbi:MAG: chemotaxis protein CheC [Ruminococcus sp.]|jgi:chemotaxis protein CheC|nr:chemotaxis protein CheC [Ruminococcus sp.]
MALTNINQLSEMHLDVLKEIGNIGSGNAASSLSELIMKPTDITVPAVKLLDFNEAINFLGGAEIIALGMLVQLVGDIKGKMIYVIQQAFASHMTETLFGMPIDDLLTMDEMATSFISEVGNIMTASYVNAIASLTNLTIDISVPEMTIDMVGAILSVPAVEFAMTGANKVLFIDDSFIIDGSEVRSNLIFVPETKSLENLFGTLGVTV